MNASYAAVFATLSFLAIPLLGLRGYLLAQLAAYSFPLIVVAVGFLSFGDGRREQAGPVIAMMLVTVAVSVATFTLYGEGAQANVLWKLALSLFSIALIAWAGWQFIFADSEIDIIVQRLLRIVSVVRRD